MVSASFGVEGVARLRLARYRAAAAGRLRFKGANER